MPHCPYFLNSHGEREQVAGLRELNARLFARKRLAAVPRQQGLGIKRIHLRRSAVHEQKDHALGAGRKHRRVRSHRVQRFAGNNTCGLRLLRHQAQQRHHAEARAALRQHFPACSWLS